MPLLDLAASPIWQTPSAELPLATALEEVPDAR